MGGIRKGVHLYGTRDGYTFAWIKGTENICSVHKIDLYVYLVYDSRIDLPSSRDRCTKYVLNVTIIQRCGLSLS